MTSMLHSHDIICQKTNMYMNILVNYYLEYDNIPSYTKL